MKSKFKLKNVRIETCTLAIWQKMETTLYSNHIKNLVSNQIVTSSISLKSEKESDKYLDISREAWFDKHQLVGKKFPAK